MKQILFLLALCSTLTAKEVARPTMKQQLIALQNGIERIILDADPNVNIGIEVVSLKTGQKLYQKNSHHLFVPASNLKLITGAIALHHLGVDYRFETKLYTDGRVTGKTLRGNLYLQGSGDPEFAVHDLEELVFQLKLLGISKVDGDIFVDNTLFDPLSQGPGWMWDDQGHEWTAPIDALTLNHSCIDLWVKPAERPGQQPFVYQYPKNDFVTIENKAETSSAQNDLRIKRRNNVTNIIDITGKIRSNEEAHHYTMPVENPHLYAAHVFQKILIKAGLNAKGNIEAKAVPPKATLLATHTSRPLYLIVEQMMKSSDNLASDCLFKKVGEQKYGAPGTWQKGSQAVREFLAQSVGLEVDKMVVTDGSGLSRYNLVSAHQMVELLKWMNGQFSCCSEFMASLPLAGTDGTLKKRMGNVKGRIRAKTGSMTGISSLSGYMTTKDGEPIAFSILQNGFTGPTEAYKGKIEDEICAFLANFSRE